VSSEIGLATTDVLSDVLELVQRSGLPIDGLADHLGDALVARTEKNVVVGCVALELYQQAALLRSLAVNPSFRNHGLGRKLTQAALRLARTRQASTVYLLTTTAEQFFPQFGFEPISRDEVPKDVRQSVQFTSACPQSARVMRKVLDESND
jgi:amino-acid N-acetyltransferase